MSPSTFSSATLPPGLETTQRIHHPPACLTVWTTLSIIYCPYSFCLCVSLCHGLAFNLSLFSHCLLYPLLLFCHTFQDGFLFLIFYFLPSLTPLLFLYCCFSGHITHLLCWGPLYGFENEHTGCLCVRFHTGFACYPSSIGLTCHPHRCAEMCTYVLI